MTQHDPLEFARLIAWLEGQLAAEAAEETARAAAAADEETRQVIEALRLLIQDREFQLESPPDTIRPLLQRRFEAFAADWRAQNHRPSLGQQLVGWLTFDSWQSAAAGLRGGQVEAPTRQIIFSTDVGEIVLDITRRRTHFDLNGQILTDADLLEIPFEVELWQASETVDHTTADELGEFTFQSLPRGTIELVLRHETTEIMLPPFRLE